MYMNMYVCVCYIYVHVCLHLYLGIFWEIYDHICLLKKKFHLTTNTIPSVGPTNMT